MKNHLCNGIDSQEHQQILGEGGFMKALKLLLSLSYEEVYTNRFMLPNEMFSKTNKDITEAIQELLESMKPKSCFLCKSLKSCGVVIVARDAMNITYFYCNDYEPKEQL